MNKRKLLIASGTAVLAMLLVLVVVGTVLGQEPAPSLSEPETIAGPAEAEQSELSIVARPAKTMNYQGYLTDGSGNPLNGSYDMVFSLWDEEAAGTGTKEWGDETHNAVSVSNGLFSVVLGETTPLDPYTDLDEQLYLEIVVNGTTLPRQMLRAVPYAMGLTIGAHSIGATDLTSQYGLWVENTNGPGLYVNGSTTYGIFNHDVTRSDDGYAGPNTYLWAPTMNTVLGSIGNSHLVYQSGYVEIDADGAGTVFAYVPIQVERPYGRDYLLDNVRVYYRVDGSAYINRALINGINFASGGQLTIGTNETDQSSTSFDYFDIDATDNYTITYDMAPTAISFNISMGAAFDTVYLYGVRLTLDSTY